MEELLIDLNDLGLGLNGSGLSNSGAENGTHSSSKQTSSLMDDLMDIFLDSRKLSAAISPMAKSSATGSGLMNDQDRKVFVPNKNFSSTELLDSMSSSANGNGWMSTQDRMVLDFSSTKPAESMSSLANGNGSSPQSPQISKRFIRTPADDTGLTGLKGTWGPKLAESSTSANGSGRMTTQDRRVFVANKSFSSTKPAESMSSSANGNGSSHQPSKPFIRTPADDTSLMGPKGTSGPKLIEPLMHAFANSSGLMSTKDISSPNPAEYFLRPSASANSVGLAHSNDASSINLQPTQDTSQPPMGTPATGTTKTKGPRKKFVRRNFPRPIMHEVWAQNRRNRASLKSEHRIQPKQVIFTLCELPEVADGVIEDINTEMQGRNPAVSVAAGKPSDSKYTYLMISSKSDAALKGAILTARTQADELIKDKTAVTSKSVVEPPNLPKGSIEILLDRQQARPKLLSRSNSPENTTQHDTGAFISNFCLDLSGALKKIGRMNSLFNVSVNFGHFFLRSRPVSRDPSNDRYTYNQLSALLKNSRAKGCVKTQVGNLQQALNMIKAIKSGSFHFISNEFDDDSPSNVRPHHTFEAISMNQTRFEVSLDLEAQAPGHSARRAALTSVRAFQESDPDDSHGELEFNTFSPGRSFDWKMETFKEHSVKEGRFQSLVAYLNKARILFPPNRPEDPEYSDADFPRVRLDPVNVLSNQFKEVAIKSTFTFRFGFTPYLVEVTIRREWPSVFWMHRREDTPKATTFGITVRCEHWGKEEEGARSICGWGDDLEHLFPDGNGKAEERVRAFVKAIHDIRDELETCSCPLF